MVPLIGFSNGKENLKEDVSPSYKEDDTLSKPPSIKSDNPKTSEGA